MLHMEIINQLDVQNDIIVDEEAGMWIFVKKPVLLDSLPIIDSELFKHKNLKNTTHELMLEYFNDILNLNNSGMRIKVIDGLHLDQSYKYYYCDYCNTHITDDWFYCNHCNKDMCKMCYSETSEESALKNGALNYKKRENQLNLCHSSKQIEPRNLYNIFRPDTDWRGCDLCEKQITANNSYYSDKETENSYDMCLDCYESNPDAKNIIKDKSMGLIDINSTNCCFTYTGFGSMLYWFPIITDLETNCQVLMNLNPNDDNYGKLCLQSCDCHARNGYYIIKNDTYNLQKVLQRLKEICDKGTTDYDSWEIIEEGVYGNVKKSVNKKKSGDWTFHSTDREEIKPPTYGYVTKTCELYSNYYASPIHILMSELNMPVYYG